MTGFGSVLSDRATARASGMSAVLPIASKLLHRSETSLRAKRRHMRRSKTASSLDQVVHADGHQPFAERTLRNIGSGLPRQSGLMLAAWITFAHFSVSSTISSLKSAGEPGSAAPPMSTNRALIFGSESPALISLLSLSMISAGVFLGAQIPDHELASYPGTNSAAGGKSGNASRRVMVVTASARSLPVL